MEQRHRRPWSFRPWPVLAASLGFLCVGVRFAFTRLASEAIERLHWLPLALPLGPVVGVAYGVIVGRRRMIDAPRRPPPKMSAWVIAIGAVALVRSSPEVAVSIVLAGSGFVAGLSGIRAGFLFLEDAQQRDAGTDRDS